MLITSAYYLTNIDIIRIYEEIYRNSEIFLNKINARNTGGLIWYYLTQIIDRCKHVPNCYYFRSYYYPKLILFERAHFENNDPHAAGSACFAGTVRSW